MISLEETNLFLLVHRELNLSEQADARSISGGGSVPVLPDLYQRAQSNPVKRRTIR